MSGQRGEPAADHLRPRPFDEASLAAGGDVLERLEFRMITEGDAWLTEAYAMLADEFPPDLMDPYDRYVQWLEWNRRRTHPFPFVLVAGYVAHGADARLVAVFEGNIMPVAEYPSVAAPSHVPSLMGDGSHILTVGHQVTSPVLRAGGVKGVGTSLFRAAVRHAREVSRQRGGVLRYGVLESEDAATGFWTKLGFRWPRGMSYWQPPLEFDDTGRAVYPDVPLRLMLLPLDDAPATEVPRTLVLDIVATLYLNWSLHAYRDQLDDSAMRRAEDHVMGALFGRVREAAPEDDLLPLVRLTTDG